MEWFGNLGDLLVDRGSPLFGGVALHGDGSVTKATSRYNGYSIIEAKDRDEALELIKNHPYLALGEEYSIEVFSKA